MRVRIALFAILTSLPATTAGAQIGGTLGKILNGIVKAGGPPPPIQIVSAARTGGDTAMVARFQADTATLRIAPTGPCGTARVCVAGWHLRVVSLSLPAASVPSRSMVPITVDIENRGRVASPASEVQLCQGAQGNPCAQRLGLEPIPSLASGEHLKLVRHVTTGDPGYGPAIFTATIDPDNATNEVNRANNVGQSPETAIELPRLELVTLTGDTQARNDAEQIAAVIRNPSTTTPTPETELRFGGNVSTSYFGDNPQYTIKFPALAPREAVSFVARVGLVTTVNRQVSGPGYVHFHIDPDRHVRWGQLPDQQSEAVTFNVVR